MPDAVQGQLAVRLVLEPEAGADAEDADRLGRRLRRELSELDVDDVRPQGDGSAPDGAKGADVASMAELLVTMSASGGVLATLVATVRDWLGRRGNAGTITLTVDGDTLELSSATAAERSQLIDVFVAHHSGS
jgi:Effector Associated Constant Component 1